jgi:hypothetical protein
VEVIRKLGGQWPDRQIAVTMNRMRCKPSDAATLSAAMAAPEQLAYSGHIR